MNGRLSIGNATKHWQLRARPLIGEHLFKTKTHGAANILPFTLLDLVHLLCKTKRSNTFTIVLRVTDSLKRTKRNIVMDDQ